MMVNVTNSIATGGAKFIEEQAITPKVLGERINHLVLGAGDDVTLVRPQGATVLWLSLESGHVRVAPAGYATDMQDGPPGATVDDGTGTLKLDHSEPLPYMAPQQLSVVGGTAGTILTYWWT